LISLDGAALRHNVQTWKQRTGAAVRAVVKADGYNFGLERLVRELDGTADGFIVSDADELQRLRAITRAPAATLQELGVEQALRVGLLGGIANVASLDSLAALAARSDAARLTVRVGLRLAAGWSGIECDDARSYAQMLVTSGMGVELWTQLTNPATEKTDRERFARFVAMFRQLGARIDGEDIESTYPAANGTIHGTSVRIGVGLFGAGSAKGVTGLRCAIAVSAPVVETLGSDGGLRASYGERALPLDQRQYFAQLLGLHHRLAMPVIVHEAHGMADVACRHVGQRMRPIFEHGLVDGLRLMQMFTPVTRDARKKNVMMAALDHVDGIDLHIAQMFHGPERRVRVVTERNACVEALRAQPHATRLLLCQSYGISG